jgi:hypothetical protein
MLLALQLKCVVAERLCPRARRAGDARAMYLAEQAGLGQWQQAELNGGGKSSRDWQCCGPGGWPRGGVRGRPINEAAMADAGPVFSNLKSCERSTMRVGVGHDILTPEICAPRGGRSRERARQLLYLWCWKSAFRSRPASRYGRRAAVFRPDCCCVRRAISAIGCCNKMRISSPPV